MTGVATGEGFVPDASSEHTITSNEKREAGYDSCVLKDIC